MSTVSITLVQPDGVEVVVPATTGVSLMESAKAYGVDGILGDCGGGCACATCHVFVDPAWMAVVGAPDDIEALTLDLAADVARPNSRLSCQISVRAELDGLRVTVAQNG